MASRLGTTPTGGTSPHPCRPRRPLGSAGAGLSPLAGSDPWALCRGLPGALEVVAPRVAAAVADTERPADVASVADSRAMVCGEREAMLPVDGPVDLQAAYPAGDVLASCLALECAGEVGVLVVVGAAVWHADLPLLVPAHLVWSRVRGE